MSSKLIEREDFLTVRELAKKYNMTVADFGRSIVRQADRSAGRAVRLSEVEYNYITEMATKNNMTVTRFCALACHAFIESENKAIPIENIVTEKANRTKRIEARFYNMADEAEMVKTSIEYSMKISALIRYCAMRYDGNNINL